MALTPFAARAKLAAHARPPLHPFHSTRCHVTRSDGGRASFTPEVVTAFRELVADPSRAISSIPRLHTDYEIELATGKLHPVPYLTVREEKFSDGGNPVVVRTGTVCLRRGGIGEGGVVVLNGGVRG